MTCTNLINLQKPTRGAWEGRGFGRRYVWTYRCDCGAEHRVRCSSWRGKRPDTAPGAIVCRAQLAAREVSP